MSHEQEISDLCTVELRSYARRRIRRAPRALVGGQEAGWAAVMLVSMLLLLGSGRVLSTSEATPLAQAIATDLAEDSVVPASRSCRPDLGDRVIFCD